MSAALGSPEAANGRAAPASGSQLDSDIVRVTNSHWNAVARGRAPEVDLLYSTTRGCLGSRQVQGQFCYGRRCAVVHLNTDWIPIIIGSMIFSHPSAFERLAIIGDHQN